MQQFKQWLGGLPTRRLQGDACRAVHPHSGTPPLQSLQRWRSAVGEALQKLLRIRLSSHSGGGGGARVGLRSVDTTQLSSVGRSLLAPSRQRNRMIARTRCDRRRSSSATAAATGAACRTAPRSAGVLRSASIGVKKWMMVLLRDQLSRSYCVHTVTAASWLTRRQRSVQHHSRLSRSGSCSCSYIKQSRCRVQHTHAPVQ